MRVCCFIILGMFLGFLITRLVLNPKLQKTSMYMEKEKYLINKLKEANSEISKSSYDKISEDVQT